MVAFLTVIVSSLIAFFYRKHNRLLLIGDVVFALSTLTALTMSIHFQWDRAFVNNVFITPGAIVWAIVHYINLLTLNGNHKHTGNREKGFEA